MNTFTAQASGAEAYFAPTLPGDVVVWPMEGQPVYLQSGSYGAIHAVDLEAGQSLTVDTGHMVGWSEGVTDAVRKVGNWKSTFLSGEGLVCDLTGPGRIHLQTRSQDAFLNWLIPKLPKSTGN